MTRKGGSETTLKRHRFVPFSKRVDAIRIDPIRRVRRHKDDTRDDGRTAYVQTSLEKWSEMNLSATFTAFRQEVAPYCLSLPLVLHYQKEIFGTLENYISKHDGLAMDALLDMLAQFARDLDVEFEPYYSRSVRLLIDLMHHPDIEVIEQSFNSLAFILKYLSKLLVPNIIPTFDILASLLGRENQRYYVRRFAAESISYLLRKAQASSLESLIHHVLDILEAHSTSEFCDGVSVMFLEAAKSVEQTLHTKAPQLLRLMLLECVERPENSVCWTVLRNVITALVHHSNAETFDPVRVALLETSTKILETGKFKSVSLQPVILCLSVRRGTRIFGTVFEMCRLTLDWNDTMIRVLLLSNKSKDVGSPSLDWEIVQLSALIIQFCELEELLPVHQQLLNMISSLRSNVFLGFCNLVSQLSRDRFEKIVQNTFYRYLTQEREFAKLQQGAVPLLLHDLDRASFPLGNLGSSFNKSVEMSIMRIVRALVEGEHSFEKSEFESSIPNLHLLRFHHNFPSSLIEPLFALVPSMLATLGKDGKHSVLLLLHEIIGVSLQLPTDVMASSIEIYNMWEALGSNLESWVSNEAIFVDFSALTLRISAERLGDLHLTLDTEIVKACLRGLRSPSQTIRLAGLQIMIFLGQSSKHPGTHILETCRDIENLAITVETPRICGVYLRKLGMQFHEVTENEIYARAVVAFLFGQQFVKLAAMGESAREVLKSITDSRADLVWELCLKWIDCHGTPTVISGPDEVGVDEADPDSTDVEQKRPDPITRSFVCTNNRDFQSVASTLRVRYSDPSRTLLDMLYNEVEPINFNVVAVRDYALQILLGVPHVAEQRSRHFVHFLLDEQSERWAPRNWVTLLQLFSRFSNPKVLYRNYEVYEKMLLMLRQKSSSVQEYALKTILAYKQESVATYAEHLEGLIDESRFREELTNFVHVEPSESIIEDKHRQELMRVLLPILYGKSVGHKAGSKNDHVSRNRTAVLQALNVLTKDEVSVFFEAVLSPFTQKSINCGDSSHHYHPDLSLEIDGRKQMGFLTMSQTIIPLVDNLPDTVSYALLDALFYCIAYSRLTDEVQGYERLQRREIRTASVRALTLFFECWDAFEFGPYMNLIFAEIISVNLPRLPEETSQAPNSVMQLLRQWSLSKRYVNSLWQKDGVILDRLLDCMSATAVKETVQVFVLDLFTSIIAHGDLPGDTNRYVERLLAKIMELMSGDTPSQKLLDACLQALTACTTCVEKGMAVDGIIKSFMPFLSMPNHKVRRATKYHVLQVIAQYLSLSKDLSLSISPNGFYMSLMSMFSHVSDKEARMSLISILRTLADANESLASVATLTSELNAYSAHRLDARDFDKRLAAFSTINERSYLHLTPLEWAPLIQNFIYYIGDLEELSLRANSAFGLQRFISCALNHEAFDTFAQMLDHYILPFFQRTAKTGHESVRIEVLGLLEFALQQKHQWPAISDLAVLRFGNDAEASFFTNVQHIQQHRRLRALRRLQEDEVVHQLKSGNVAHLLMPLVEHYVFQRSGDEHNASAESVRALGKLSKQLQWSQWKPLILRYYKMVEDKDRQAVGIRLLAHIIDGFNETVNVDKVCALARSLPALETWRSFLRSGVLEPLSQFVHHRDESMVSLRVPASIIVVKLLKLQGEEERAAKLPSLLTDIAHILRSRTQESRDMVRTSLCEMATLLGAQYLPFIVKQLRGALLRGYQLHVLGYTVHAILVALSNAHQLHSLDESLPGLVDIIVDDIFGSTGQEKEAEGYVSSMKEVKNSKSYDSMELIASATALTQMSTLLSPVQRLCGEKMNSRLSAKVDQVLRRLQQGLLRNADAGSQDMLVVSFQLFQQSMAQDGGHKTARFALDLLRMALQKFPQLSTASNIGPLHGPLAGEAILSAHEELKVAGFRLLTLLARTPTPELVDGMQVYSTHALDGIKRSPRSNSDLCLACLKFLAVALGNVPDFEVKESGLVYLLGRISTDLEEPDRQGVMFSLIKAILSRKIVIKEVYDVMDRTAHIMVTNQSKGSRDGARSLYIQFLLDFPQGKGRFEKQLRFVVKNLEYVHASGRESNLETLHLMLSKFHGNAVQDVVGTLWVPLVMVMCNDEAKICRHMASELLFLAYRKAKSPLRASLLGMARTWMEGSGPLVRAGLKVYGVCLQDPSFSGEEAIVNAHIAGLLNGDPDEEDAMAALETWKFMTVYRSAVASEEVQVWQQVQALISAPSIPVQVIVAQLLHWHLEAVRGGRPWPTENLLAMADKSLGVLMHVESDELCKQTLENLILAAQLLYAEYKLGDGDGDEFFPRRAYIPWTVHRVSQVVRLNRTGHESVAGKRAGVQYLGSLVTLLSEEDLVSLAPSLLSPVVLLMEEGGPPGDLAAGWTEEMHRKIGTTAYTAAYQEVKGGIVSRRQDRNHKRKMDKMQHGSTKPKTKSKRPKNMPKHMQQL